MLEWYEAYADYDDIADAARGADRATWPTEVGYDGPIDFSPPVEADHAARRDQGEDRASTSPRRRGAAAARAPGPSAWTRCCPSRSSPTSQNPTFILDYPKELSPFAKDHRSEPGLVERFECFAAGMEFANAFTELNDPDEQRARFEQQRADQAAGDEETQPYDEDYVARAGARHAAHRRHRHRHRPAGDDPQRPRLDPRGRALPRDAAASSLDARCSASSARSRARATSSAARRALAALALLHALARAGGRRPRRGATACRGGEQRRRTARRLRALSRRAKLVGACRRARRRSGPAGARSRGSSASCRVRLRGPRSWLEPVELRDRACCSPVRRSESVSELPPQPARAGKQDDARPANG